jgi:micrococcal nuclease
VSGRAALRWIGLFALLAFLGGGGLELLSGLRSGADDTLESDVSGRIIRVVDGDTVRVRLDRPRQTRTVRYIGVDTPETVKPGEPVQCFGKAASAFNSRLVAGRRVRLELGRERFDRYGRLLAYVFVERDGQLFVNAELLRRGYARTLAIAPNTDRAARFARLARGAQRAGLGLWRACPYG